MLGDRSKGLTIESLKCVNTSAVQLLLWIKGIITLHKLLNPLIFISTEYVRNRCTDNELEHIEYIYQNIENWKIIYNIQLQSNRGEQGRREQTYLEGLVRQAKEKFDMDYIEYPNLKKVGEDEINIQLFYFSTKDVFILYYILDYPKGCKTCTNRESLDPILIII